MSKRAAMTAAEWLRVRSAVADRLKVEGSQQQAATRERVAEGLLLSGYIDIAFVLESVTPVTEPSRDAETEEA